MSHARGNLKDGPTSVWLCTDCKHCDLSQGPEPDWQWWYRCIQEDGKKICVSKYALGRDVHTPAWCPTKEKQK